MEQRYLVLKRCDRFQHIMIVASKAIARWFHSSEGGSSVHRFRVCRLVDGCFDPRSAEFALCCVRRVLRSRSSTSLLQEDLVEEGTQLLMSYHYPASHNDKEILLTRTLCKVFYHS